VQTEKTARQKQQHRFTKSGSLPFCAHISPTQGRGVLQPFRPLCAKSYESFTMMRATLLEVRYDAFARSQRVLALRTSLPRA
jgi:hypothetical protein